MISSTAAALSCTYSCPLYSYCQCSISSISICCIQHLGLQSNSPVLESTRSTGKTSGWALRTLTIEQTTSRTAGRGLNKTRRQQKSLSWSTRQNKWTWVKWREAIAVEQMQMLWAKGLINLKLTWSQDPGSNGPDLSKSVKLNSWRYPGRLEILDLSEMKICILKWAVLRLVLDVWIPNQSKCEVKWFWFDGLWAEACAPSKRAVRAIVYGSGLWDLRSQVEKLFRSDLIIVGWDWLKTLRGDLVLCLCVDLVLG